VFDTCGLEHFNPRPELAFPRAKAPPKKSSESELTLIRMVQDHDLPMGLAHLGLGADWAGERKKKKKNVSNHPVLLLSFQRTSNNNNNNNSDFYSAFLNTQRRFTGNKRQTERNKEKADKTNKQEQ